MWVSEDLMSLGGIKALRIIEERKENEVIEKSRTGAVQSARFY